MRFTDIPVIDGRNTYLYDFQVAFSYSPLKKEDGTVNHNRVTRCQVSVLIPSTETQTFVDGQKYALVSKEGQKEFQTVENGPNVIAVPIAFGECRTSAGDNFSRVKGRKLALGKAISALTRNRRPRTDRGTLPGKDIVRFDISPATGKALFMALEKVLHAIALEKAKT